MPRDAFIVLFVALLSSLSGCGADTGGRVGVSGTVTFQGVPLESGTIQFAATDGSQMSGATISAGKYEVPAMQGLLPGKYMVRVSAVKEAAAEVGAPGDSTIADAKNQELIPAEFNVNSTITTEITSQAVNTFDLAIP
jgi:hypothetical protein